MVEAADESDPRWDPDDDCATAALDGLAFAYGKPAIQARLRASPDDFRVDEILGFSADGAGQHVLLRVRKREWNTAAVASRIARLAGVSPRAIGFAGLKDRDAVTTQWFSLDLGGRDEPDWGALDETGIRVLESSRHGRKLRRGAHEGNRFRIVLRGLSELDGLDRRVERVRMGGVPNYFGEQRFGNAGGNLVAARALLAGETRVRDRSRRGIYLSAARSLLFNRVLSSRVAAGNWDRPLSGEVLMLDGSHSLFNAEDPDEALLQRATAGDVHPTGPLWGEGGMRPQGSAGVVEREALKPCDWWCRALERQGLAHSRRSLRVLPRGIEAEAMESGAAAVTFELPAGAFATTVLRELLVSV